MLQIQGKPCTTHHNSCDNSQEDCLRNPLEGTHFKHKFIEDLTKKLNHSHLNFKISVNSSGREIFEDLVVTVNNLESSENLEIFYQFYYFSVEQRFSLQDFILVNFASYFETFCKLRHKMATSCYDSLKTFDDNALFNIIIRKRFNCNSDTLIHHEISQGEYVNFMEINDDRHIFPLLSSTTGRQFMLKQSTEYFENLLKNQFHQDILQKVIIDQQKSFMELSELFKRKLIISLENFELERGNYMESQKVYIELASISEITPCEFLNNIEIEDDPLLDLLVKSKTLKSDYEDHIVSLTNELNACENKTIKVLQDLTQERNKTARILKRFKHAKAEEISQLNLLENSNELLRKFKKENARLRKQLNDKNRVVFDLKQTNESFKIELLDQQKRLDEAETRNSNLMSDLNRFHSSSGRQDIVEMNEFLYNLRLAIDGRSGIRVDEVYTDMSENNVMVEE